MALKQLHHDPSYQGWLVELKAKVRSTQLKAAIAVNRELLNFYWDLGAEIVAKQANSQWGDRFLQQLSHDLMTEFLDMKGVSLRNLKYVRQWYLFYSTPPEIGQQPVAQITQIPSDGLRKNNR